MPNILNLQPIDVNYFSNREEFNAQRKPEYCKSCPLSGARRCIELPVGNPEQVDVVIIVGTPALDDTYPSDTYFAARKWRLFKKVVRGLTEKHLVSCKIVHSVLCVPPKKSAPIRAVRHCSRFLLERLRVMKPKVIIAVGTTAYKALGFKQVVSNYRGNIQAYTLDDHQCWVIPTHSVEQYFDYKLKMFSTFILELEKAINIAKNGYQRKDPRELQKSLLFPKGEEAIEFVKDLTDKQNLTVAFDIETFREGTLKEAALNPFHPLAEVTVLSFAWGDGRSAAIDTRNAPEEFWEAVRKFFLSSTHKIAHNAKFDLYFLKVLHGIEINNFIGDTMLNHWLIDENRAGGSERNLKGEYTLKRLTWDYLSEYGGYEEYGGVGKHIKDGVFSDVDFDAVLTYAAIDTLVTWLLNHRQIRLLLGLRPEASRDQVAIALARNSDDSRLYRNCAQSLLVKATQAIVEIESAGITIDKELLDKYHSQASDMIGAITERLSISVGPDFEPSKNAQLVKFLYKDLKLPVERRTKEGGPSTDEEALTAFLGRHEAIQDILSYKTLTKLRSSFLAPLYELMDSNGKIHPQYKLEGTRTGRLSCEKPNVQQMPKIMGCGRFDKNTGRYETEFNVKSLFIPRPGYTMIAADYSQIEVVILACYAKDKLLIQAIEEGLDIHSFLASKLYNKDYLEIKKNKEQEPYKSWRRQAKTVVFGAMYGSTAKGMAFKQGITEEEAQELIDAFMALCPGIKKFVDGMHNMARRKFYVNTFFDRRRHFPVLQWQPHNPSLRQAQNSPIQSSAADLTLSGVIELTQELKSLDGAVLLTVHDSIVSEVPDSPETIEAAKQLYYKVLCEDPRKKYPWLITPTKIDLEVGKSWGGMK